MYRTSRELDRLDAQLLRMIDLCADEGVAAESAPRVSAWSVGQQVDHLSRVGLDVTRALAALVETGAFPDRATGEKTRWFGVVLLRLGWLPRGVAEAPKGVRPSEGEPASTIRARCEEIRTRLGELRVRTDALDGARARRRHPRFGGLTPNAWIRFLAVHQHHHLKIVRDIRRAARLPGRGAGPASQESET